MTCTQCFQKIAPSSLEKSCKGEHRQEGVWLEERKFLYGAKGLWGGAFAPSWVFEPPSLTLKPQPFMLTPGLAHFGGWRSLCSLCEWMWREPTAMALEAKLCLQRWGAWKTVSALLSCSWPVSSTKLSRNLFLESGTFLWRPGLVLFLVLQCLHCSSFGSPVSS